MIRIASAKPSLSISLSQTHMTKKLIANIFHCKFWTNEDDTRTEWKMYEDGEQRILWVRDNLDFIVFIRFYFIFWCNSQFVPHTLFNSQSVSSPVCSVFVTIKWKIVRSALNWAHTNNNNDCSICYDSRTALLPVNIRNNNKNHLSFVDQRAQHNALRKVEMEYT